MAQLLHQRWRAEPDGPGLTRGDRSGCDYDAYVPDALGGRIVHLEGSVAADIADAERGIAELDRSAVALGNTEALARLLLRAESVASSRIEGLEIGPRRLLQADAARDRGEAVNDVTAADVLANIDAMAYAVEAVGTSTDLTIDHLLEAHRRLLMRTRLAAHAGRIRTIQNWMGGSVYNPCSAAFVPPPPELVEELLADLCAFCNDDALPAVAQAAIAHAQFETIHPFVDGNGRIGRALIHMVLRRRGVVKRIFPPVSLVLATHADQYVAALTAPIPWRRRMSDAATQSIAGWVAMFSGACIRAVHDAESFEERIGEIQGRWHERLGTTRGHSAVHALLSVIPGAPVLTVKSAVELTGRSLIAVNDAIARLVEAGIVKQTKAQARNRTFEARGIIDAFVDLERRLASPAGDTRVERPARHVPRRPVRRSL